MCTEPVLLVTPDRNGEVKVPRAGARLPAACYVENPIKGIAPAYLPDIWRDDDRAAVIAGESVAASHELARRVIEDITGSRDEDLLPLTLDLCNLFVEAALERSLRLADTLSGASHGHVLVPASLSHTFSRVETGAQLKQIQKRQSFQWLVLRLLANACDKVEIGEPRLWPRMRRRLALARHIRIAQRSRHRGWYAAGLGRYESAFQKVGIDFALPPQLVQQYVLRRDQMTRTRIAGSFEEVVAPAIRRIGSPAEGIVDLARLFGELFPSSRVEAMRENLSRYDAFVARQSVAGFVTATGHGKQDPNSFFMAACNRHCRPVVVVQHGGQYGYDDKIPGYITCDLGLPTHFASWGWDEVSPRCASKNNRANIIPMPDPRMSEIARHGESIRRPDGPRTLLVPLSKFRTLDNRLGGNSTDGVVLTLRTFVQDVLELARHGFDRIIVTHRGSDFARDPLGLWLASQSDARIEVKSSAEMPASKILDQVHAVLWDVTATGLFETLNFGVPTVARFQRGRWAENAAWAEQLMHQNGIAAYSPEAAARSLSLFASDADAWRSALLSVQPVLDKFARARPDWRDQWHEFFNRVSAFNADPAIGRQAHV
jgi:hypothetical protein